MNQFILWNDLRLFWGSNTRPIARHSHPVVQLVLATKGHFLSKSRKGEWVEKTGLLIAPNYQHECDARNIPLLSIDIDPESDLGEWILVNQLAERQVIDFSLGNQGQATFQTITEHLSNENWPAVRRSIEQIFRFQLPESRGKKDDRIESVLTFIAEHINQPIDTKMLTAVAFLSESRLLHLFKEKMGLPIRSYILWYRLKIVLELIMEGYSLTQAAYQAGFADQAHLTRTCVKMLGVPPSAISKNSKFVQVSFPH